LPFLSPYSACSLASAPTRFARSGRSIDIPFVVLENLRTLNRRGRGLQVDLTFGRAEGARASTVGVV
jgi:hypothetical protein